MGSGRHPPSEVYGWECDCEVAMEMKLPVHIWAMLSHGREAESAIELVKSRGVTEKGIGCRERWREHDGERHEEWRDGDGELGARRWREWYAQQMVWEKKDGAWRPRGWIWEEYDRDKDRDEMKSLGSRASDALWAVIPQEVLLLTLQRSVNVSTHPNSFFILRS